MTFFIVDDHRTFRRRIAEAKADARRLRGVASAIKSRHASKARDIVRPAVIPDLMVCVSEGRPATLSRAVILDARGAKPWQAVALDGTLPAQKFIDG